MRRLIAVAAALMALAIPSTAFANFLESAPRYIGGNGQTCTVRIGTSLFDDSTYFLGIDVIQNLQAGCGYISGTGWNRPGVYHFDSGAPACFWRQEHSNPAWAITVDRYYFTVCQGAPAWYISTHRHGVNLCCGARWVIGPGVHNVGSGRTITVDSTNRYMTIEHRNAEYIQ